MVWTSIRPKREIFWNSSLKTYSSKYLWCLLRFKQEEVLCMDTRGLFHSWRWSLWTLETIKLFHMKNIMRHSSLRNRHLGWIAQRWSAIQQCRLEEGHRLYLSQYYNRRDVGHLVGAVKIWSRISIKEFHKLLSINLNLYHVLFLS